jgi:hypothetical protein
MGQLMVIINTIFLLLVVHLPFLMLAVEVKSNTYVLAVVQAVVGIMEVEEEQVVTEQMKLSQ